MGLAVRTLIDRGFGSTTLELKISMLRPITPDSGVLRVEGIVLSKKLIAVQTGATIKGRLFAQTAITLQMNVVKKPK